MRVCMFRMFMEQRTVARFLILKGLRASAIAELKSVYETEVCALSPVKKWCKCFAEGRTSLRRPEEPRFRRPLAHGSAEAISAMRKERLYLSCKVLCRHFRIAKGTCLRILRDSTLHNGRHLARKSLKEWTRLSAPLSLCSRLFGRQGLPSARFNDARVQI
jgi:hypothetical protein